MLSNKLFVYVSKCICEKKSIRLIHSINHYLIALDDRFSMRMIFKDLRWGEQINLLITHLAPKIKLIGTKLGCSSLNSKEASFQIKFYVQTPSKFTKFVGDCKNKTKTKKTNKTKQANETET